ncbi:hypothetical protein B0T17DRAFT_523097 [Bombardia bombarda]|uniref:Uncharacterized protein n=1 Tax=Bombardia bombarda TaxID=252184 RepID=A0AA40C868_9PEZI|nr:hypothetical protein B0T17DRAFT_523097 [Bombardia bombarda]
MVCLVWYLPFLCLFSFLVTCLSVCLSVIDRPLSGSITPHCEQCASSKFLSR